MAVSGIFNKVTFVSKLPLLMKATSADPTPPAGHVYNEIARITFESLEQSDVLVEFLVDRLKKNSPYVKWKVLLIIKAVLANGHEEFRHSLSKQYHGIREAKSFNGPSDPLHGDSPYVNVRESAGEVLQLLFDTDWTRKSSTNSDASNKVKMKGFGSSRFGGSPDGNHRQELNMSQSSKDSTSKDGNLLSYAVQRVKDNIAYVLNENVGAISKYQQQQPEGKSSSGYYQFCETDRKVVSEPSQTLGMFTSSPDDTTEYYHESSEQQSSCEINKLKLASDSIVASEDSQDRAPSPKDTPIRQENDDWSLEESAVEKITTTGERQNPGRSELQEFTKKCEVLNFERIVDLIGKKLECSDHRVQMRTLAVVETLLHRGIPSAQELFQSRLISRIESLGASSQKSVKNKASKLLHILHPQHSGPDVSHPSPVVEKQSPVPQLVDLLSDLTVSNPTDAEVQPKSTIANDTVETFLIDVTEQGNGGSTTAQNFEDTISPNSSDVLCSLESENQKLNVSEFAISNSSSLLDLDPFSEMESIVSSTHSQPVSSCITSTGNSSSAVVDGKLNLDPFSVDSLFTPKAEGIAKEPGTSSNSGFDFLLFDNKSMENSTIDTSKPPLVDAYDSVQPGFSQPIFYQQRLTEMRHHLPQFHNMNQHHALANQITTGSNGSSMSFSASPATVAMGPRVVNRPRATDSNGFDFITSGKKAGPFDFVREEMEASKKN